MVTGGERNYRKVNEERGNTGAREEALRMFARGFNCAQAVFAAFGPGLGLSTDQALRVSSAFGGGMGRMGEVCGAVTGAFMVMGFKYGWSDAVDSASKGMVYGLVREFAARFKSRHGSIICRDLLGCELGTPEGMAQAQSKRFHTEICPEFVGDACLILEELG